MIFPAPFPLTFTAGAQDPVYLSALRALLPPGWLFSERAPVLTGLLRGIGDEIGQVRLRQRALAAEADVRTVTEMWPEWASALGLPSARVPMWEDTAEGRRAALVRQRTATYETTLANYRAALADIGWTLVATARHSLPTTVSAAGYSHECLASPIRAGDRASRRAYGDAYGYATDFVLAPSSPAAHTELAVTLIQDMTPMHVTPRVLFPKYRMTVSWTGTAEGAYWFARVGDQVLWDGYEDAPGQGYGRGIGEVLAATNGATPGAFTLWLGDVLGSFFNGVWLPGGEYFGGAWYSTGQYTFEDNLLPFLGDGIPPGFPVNIYGRRPVTTPFYARTGRPVATFTDLIFTSDLAV